MRKAELILSNFVFKRNLLVWYLPLKLSSLMIIISITINYNQHHLEWVGEERWAPFIDWQRFPDNCCSQLYQRQKGLRCHYFVATINIDDNSLIRFGRYHSTSPPVSGFLELWRSKTRFYHDFHNTFSSPIILTWFSLKAIKRFIMSPTPGVSPYRWALLLCAHLQSAWLFLTITIFLMRNIQCTTYIPRLLVSYPSR